MVMVMVMVTVVIVVGCDNGHRVTVVSQDLCNLCNPCCGPQRFYFNPNQKDPNAMDVDAMMTKEKMEMMMKGLCFGCKKLGQLSQNCPNKMPKTLPLQSQKKMKERELPAHIRSLLAQMEENNVNDFFNNAKKEGF